MRAVVVVGLTLVSGCQGGAGGCSQEIPGGFPLDRRGDHYVQARVSDSGFAAIEEYGPELLAEQLGGTGGVVEFPIPADCQSDNEICCQNGQPVVPCGPIELDFSPIPNGAPRLELTPGNNQPTLTVVARTRAKTLSDIPVKIPVAGNCTINYNSERARDDDLKVVLGLRFQQNLSSETTELVTDSVDIEDVNNGDIDIDGGFGCEIADTLKLFFKGTLVRTLEDEIKSALDSATCSQCLSGNIAECNGLASACTDGVCMVGDKCLQTLGFIGRLGLGDLSGIFPLGSELDVYQVASGYAQGSNGGLALAIAGGGMPANNHYCVPELEAPALGGVQLSPMLDRNTTADGDDYDVAIGVARENLAQLGWAAHQSGALCLDLGTAQTDFVTTDTIGLFASSIGEYTRGKSGQAEIRLRPGMPPSFALDTDGDATILTLGLPELELDFVVYVDLHPIRVLTVKFDATLPLELIADDGGLALGLKTGQDYLANTEVLYSKPLREKPSDLQKKIPDFLNGLLPQALSGVGPITLPGFGSLELKVVAVGAEDNNELLTLYTALEKSDPQGTPLTLQSLQAPTEPASTAVVEVAAADSGTILRTAKPAKAPTQATGCSSQRGNGLAILALLGLTLVFRRFFSVALVLALGTVASGCGSPCLDGTCFQGEVERGPFGLHQTIAADKDDVAVFCYEEKQGDLVRGRLNNDDEIEFDVIAGVPDEKPVYEPKTYRGGIASPGDDVGEYASAIMLKDGAAVAYRNKTQNALILGYEDGNKWKETVVYTGEAQEVVATQIDLAADGNGKLAIAFRAENVVDGNERRAELRVATGTSVEGPFSVKTVSTTSMSCSGLCDDSTACVLAGATSTCETPTNDCTDPCGSGTICLSGTCQQVLEPSAVIPNHSGAGMYATAVYNSAGKLFVGHVIGDTPTIEVYDMGALSQPILSVDTSTIGGNPQDFHLAANSQPHVAWQGRDKALYYATVAGLTEVIDTGFRSNERKHIVGKGVTLLFSDNGLEAYYQDGSTGELLKAKDVGDNWEVSSPATLDATAGFFIDATAVDGKPIVGMMGFDKADRPMGEVFIVR